MSPVDMLWGWYVLSVVARVTERFHLLTCPWRLQCDVNMGHTWVPCLLLPSGASVVAAVPEVFVLGWAIVVSAERAVPDPGWIKFGPVVQRTTEELGLLDQTCLALFHGTTCSWDPEG